MRYDPGMNAFRAFLVLSLAFFAREAAGQTMAFGCPAPGTTFVFDSGTKVVSRGQDGIDCKMDTVEGSPFKMRALLVPNPGPDGSDTSAFLATLKPERLWPLSVGKKVEARHSTPQGTWSYILRVADYEQRQGPRGALVDTFVIELNEQGPEDFRSVSRWWISPVEKYMIRFDATNSKQVANRAVVTEITR